MKILFDCTSVQPMKKMKINGGGEYALVILKELYDCVQLYDSELMIITSKEYGSNRKLDEIGKELKCYSYNDHEELSEIINSCCADVVVFPVFYPCYSDLVIHGGIKVIGGIHDLSTLYYAMLGGQPGQFMHLDGLDWLRYIYKRLGKNEDIKTSIKQHKRLFKLNSNTYVYTVSYYTKSAIEYYLNEDVFEVYYSPMKISECASIEDERHVMEEMSLMDTPFILLSNAGRWTKNNYRVLQAIDQMIDDNILEKDYRVVVLGCDIESETFYRKKTVNSDRFSYYGYVDDKTLEVLYKKAFMYIYPSMVEGFGYPPLEAMRHGTLVLTSTSTSIPEICGDAAIYFEPTDLEAIKLAIIRALIPEYRISVIERINNRIKFIEEKQKRDLVSLRNYIFGVKNDQEKRDNC